MTRKSNQQDRQMDLTTRRTKPQSLPKSAKIAIEAGARGISNTIEGINDLVDLGRDAIAVAKANNKREDSAEFAMAKTKDLKELYAEITELRATGKEVTKIVEGKEVKVLEVSDLLQAQIDTIQKSIGLVSAIEIEYK